MDVPFPTRSFLQTGSIGEAAVLTCTRTPGPRPYLCLKEIGITTGVSLIAPSYKKQGGSSAIGLCAHTINMSVVIISYSDNLLVFLFAVL